MKLFTKKIYNKLVETLSNSNKTTLKNNLKEIHNEIGRKLNSFYIKDKKQMHKWKKHMDTIWGEQFEMLKMYSVCSKEILYNLNKTSKNVDNKFFITISLFSRAIQIFDSIVILLQNGYSDGAYSLWRGLFEILIVTEKLLLADNDTSQMFIDHAILNEYLFEKTARKNGKKYFTTKLFTEYETKYKEFETKYDILLFQKDYGWNYKNLTGKQKRTTFAILLENSKYIHLKEYYLKSNNFVHASPTGTFRKNSQLDGDNRILYCQTDYGLSYPGQNIIIVLMNIITEITSEYQNELNSAIIIFLAPMVDFCLKSFAEVEGKIERAHGMSKEDIM